MYVRGCDSEILPHRFKAWPLDCRRYFKSQCEKNYPLRLPDKYKTCKNNGSPTVDGNRNRSAPHPTSPLSNVDLDPEFVHDLQ